MLLASTLFAMGFALFIGPSIASRPITAIGQVDERAAIGFTADETNEITFEQASLFVAQPFEKFEAQQFFSERTSFLDEIEEMLVAARLAAMQPAIAFPLADIARGLVIETKVGVNICFPFAHRS